MKPTSRVALCGMMGALALVSLLLTVIPFATYALPALASVFVFPAVIECGRRYGAAVYAATALLALLLTPDMEAKILYIAFFGYYPLIKLVAESGKRLWEWLLKIGVFNVAVIAAYAVAIGIGGLSAESFAVEGVALPLPVMMGVFLLLGNGVFVLYDIALTRALSLYFIRLQPMLHRLFR